MTFPIVQSFSIKQKYILLLIHDDTDIIRIINKKDNK